MSDIRSQILESQYKRSSQMATIIGRYKGGMEVFSDQIRYFALNSEGINEYQKSELCRVADLMNNVVAENEKLWAEMNSSTEQDIAARDRGGRPQPTIEDIVELERA